MQNETKETVSSTPETGTDLSIRGNRRLNEQLIKYALGLCAFISIFTTIGIILVLSKETIGFFSEVSLLEFLFGTKWSPSVEPTSFGVLPLVCGTFLIVIGSGVIALPIGLASAIYLSEYASDRTRSIVKPFLEILAGIPTIVYGYFALQIITPVFKPIFAMIGLEMSRYNALSASIVVGVMILPMVTSLCDDALRAVPKALRQAAFGLGATDFEVSFQIVLPAALSGCFAAFVLAISRAVGETMAVTLAAGANPNITLNPLSSIQTMTAYIVQTTTGEAEYGSIAYQSLYAVASLLFVSTLILNLAAFFIKRRYREEYQ